MKDYNKYKISDSTPIKLFPDGDSSPDGFVGYNGFVADLLDEINRLNNLVSSKDTEIQILRSRVITLENDLRAYFSAWFDRKMNEFENEFVKKTNN